MYIKELELNGFKTFAKKTVLEFPCSLVGIVGPNGSGKSNLCDGIRWVLGEQSTRTLRSERMNDCIFAGTEKVKGSEQAEVSLTFNNDSHIFPVEGDLKVTRRLHNEKGSDYLMNNDNCKLKDIRMAMMDTGLSKDAYSIIGQGMIEQIVSASGAERRILLEEAAGIMRYKHQRNETMRKLRETEKNIDTLRSILLELDRQRQPLELQAQYARRFLTLKEELDTKEITIGLYDRHSILREEMQGLATIEELQKRQTEAEEKILQFTAQIEELDAKILVADERVEHLKQDNSSLIEELETARNQRQTLFEQINSRQNQLDKLQAAEEENRNYLESIDNEIRDLTEELTRSEKQRVILEAAVNEKDAAIKKLGGKLKLTEDELQGGRDNTITSLNDLARRKNHLQSLKGDLELVREKIRRYKEDIRRLESEQSEATERTYKDRIDEKKKMDSLKSFKGQVDAFEREVAELREQDQYFQKKIQTTIIEISRIESELKTREKLKESEQDIRYPVKMILEEKNKGQFPGISGMVADLINTGKDLEVAIEVALGGYLQAIVTETADDAKRGVEFLKRNRFGRVTFLPMDLVHGRGVRRESPFPGLVGTAIDLVTFDDRYRTIMEYLLGNVIVVENMDVAIKTSRSGFRGKIVTIEGEVVSGSGVVTGGSLKRNSHSLLSSGIDGLRMRLTSLVTSRTADKDKIAVISANLRRTEERLSHVRIEYEKLKENISVSYRGTEEIQDLTSRRENQLDVFKLELEEILKEETRLVAESSKEEQYVTEMNQRVEAREARLRQVQDGTKKEREELENLMNSSMEVREEYSALSQRCADLEERLKRHHGTIEKVDIKMLEYSRSREILQIEMDKLVKQAEAGKAAFETLVDSARGFQEEINQLETELKVNRQAREIKDRLVKSREKSISEFVEKIYGTKNKLNRYVLRREAIEERLLEEFNLTQEQMDAPVERGINREQLLSSINGLKSDIQLLGEVNLHSIKEHELVVERCTFYEEQIDDLETGRQSTLGIIAEIDAKCEIRLVKTLDEINGHIEEIFQILFGGGDVKLAFDHPEDVLNSPLDIIARPPGKKRQSIMLLSGGEKTMTALSLIFAILRVKPSPFCILDEVEAALDENNVRRFIEMLKTFTEHTQFLIITHNKVTMQYLDLLYGITMEEKGMSNVISVKLEEAIEMSEEFEPKMKLSETGLSEGMKLKTAKVAVA